MRCAELAAFTLARFTGDASRWAHGHEWTSAIPHLASRLVASGATYGRRRVHALHRELLVPTLRQMIKVVTKARGVWLVCKSLLGHSYTET